MGSVNANISFLLNLIVSFFFPLNKKDGIRVLSESNKPVHPSLFKSAFFCSCVSTNIGLTDTGFFFFFRQMESLP